MVTADVTALPAAAAFSAMGRGCCLLFVVLGMLLQISAPLVGCHTAADGKLCSMMNVYEAEHVQAC